MKRNRNAKVASRRDNLEGTAARRTAAYRSPYDVPKGARPTRLPDARVRPEGEAP